LHGLRFAKWRAVVKIGSDGCPTTTAIHENAHGLARYAQVGSHCCCCISQQQRAQCRWQMGAHAAACPCL